MVVRAADVLSALYLEDETAWLDRMAQLAADGRVEQLDLPHLAEYLSDMARRDRREVESRLVLLMAHLLKWEHQPTHRTTSWRLTILEQGQELARLIGRGVLRNHASEVLDDLYPEAVGRAAVETRLDPRAFPSPCPFTLEALLEAASSIGSAPD